MGMALFQLVRGVVVAAVVFVIGLISFWAMAKVSFAVGAVVFIGLAALFYLQGLRSVPADPPMMGVPEFWGSYIYADGGGVALKSGYWFLPFAGMLFKYVLLDAKEINFAMSVTERTPDKSEVSVDPYFTYVVDKEKPVRFILAGDKADVELKLSERVKGRLREWISSAREGPLTLSEALQSNGLAMDILIQKLFPDHLEPVDDAIIAKIPNGDGIPISTFMKYFTEKPPLPAKSPGGNEILREEWKAKRTLDELKKKDRSTWNELAAAIQKRVRAIEDVKSGFCSFPIENLGIIIKLASLGNITPVGATAEGADEVARAKQTALVNSIASDNFQDQVEKFAKAHGGDMKAATEAIQLLRKLTTKDIKEQQFALRADNLAVLENLVGPIGAAWAQRINPTGNPGGTINP